MHLIRLSRKRELQLCRPMVVHSAKSGPPGLMSNGLPSSTDGLGKSVYFGFVQQFPFGMVLYVLVPSRHWLSAAEAIKLVSYEVFCSNFY